MCLIVFAFQADPQYDLIVVANRDEYYQRPTAPLHYWEDDPDVLAGRDLVQMGTWMGITKQGRFAALTNYRDGTKDDNRLSRSRGELVSRFLLNRDTPEQYLSSVQRDRETYPGFNLVVGDIRRLFYYSSIENVMRRLEPGLYGLSNHLLDTPWPKVMRGKGELHRCLQKGADTKCLLSLLQHDEPAPDERLPSTGVSLEWERRLSPLFIKSTEYGTRSSAVILANSSSVSFIERTYDWHTYTDRAFAFDIIE